MPRPNPPIPHITDPAQRYEATTGDPLQNGTDSKSFRPGLAGEAWRTFGGSADASNDCQASETGPARRLVIEQIVAAIGPSIRADERQACAELARNFLPIRAMFDASFAEALDLLADKIESRQ